VGRIKKRKCQNEKAGGGEQHPPGEEATFKGVWCDKKNRKNVGKTTSTTPVREEFVEGTLIEANKKGRLLVQTQKFQLGLGKKKEKGGRAGK